VAADILTACEEARIPVPESVAVLGVDNDPLFCEMARVPISSIRHDLEGMAYEAAALLDHLMSGKRAPKENIRLAPKGIVTRRSTDILAVDNLQVARALRFIGDNYANAQLDIRHVVGATKISRRMLEKLFRKELKRSINEEIIRVRLSKVRELLGSSTAPVAEIAAATGFSRPNHLYRVFKKIFGVTPNSFRACEKNQAPLENGSLRSIRRLTSV
jgi:LacI family transcriptional regulator